MPEGNITNVKNFFILCFPGLLPDYYGLVSAVMFCVYMCTLLGNGLFFALYIKEKSLQKPMYFIMLNLAASDILFSTTILPKMIARYWFGDSSISFAGCFIQMHFVHYFGSVNAFILAIMAFDRYVAICYPLRYANIIKESTILGLCLTCWLIAEPTIFSIVFRATTLSYCASNKVTHCYCDHGFVTRLSCTDRTPNVFSAVVSAMVVLLTPLAFILFSFGAIIVTVFRTSSRRGHLKALSTCSSQLLIITLYFLPRCINYLGTSVGINYNIDVQIFLILLYSMLPPMINPVIYCLRTKEAKECIKKHLKFDPFSVFEN